MELYDAGAKSNKRKIKGQNFYAVQLVISTKTHINTDERMKKKKLIVYAKYPYNLFICRHACRHALIYSLAETCTHTNPARERERESERYMHTIVHVALVNVNAATMV